MGLAHTLFHKEDTVHTKGESLTVTAKLLHDINHYRFARLVMLWFKSSLVPMIWYGYTGCVKGK